MEPGRIVKTDDEQLFHKSTATISKLYIDVTDRLEVSETAQGQVAQRFLTTRRTDKSGQPHFKVDL